MLFYKTQNIYRRVSSDLPANQKIANDVGFSLEQLHEYMERRGVIGFMDNIKEAGQRAADIVTNMLEFSRAQNPQYESVLLNNVLDRSIELGLHSIFANPQFKHINTEIDKQFPDTCPFVECSAVEIQQVILNLMSNALHAFAEGPAEDSLMMTIRLSFSETEAIIKVIDNGPGMDTWTQRHIFDLLHHQRGG